MTVTKLLLRFLIVSGSLMLLLACEPSAEPADGANDAVTIDPNAAVISARVLETDLQPGDPVSIELSVNKITATEGGGITLRFDPRMIRVDSVEFDPVWNFAHQSGVIDNAAGEVSDILFSSFGSPSGTIGLITVRATATGSGSAELTILESIRNPFAGGGKRLAVRFEPLNIEVR